MRDDGFEEFGNTKGGGGAVPYAAYVNVRWKKGGAKHTSTTINIDPDIIANSRLMFSAKELNDKHMRVFILHNRTSKLIRLKFEMRNDGSGYTLSNRGARRRLQIGDKMLAKSIGERDKEELVLIESSKDDLTFKY